MRPERWKLLASCLATFMLLLDITIVQAALPAIQQRLGSGLSGQQWTVDAYTLPLAALITSLGTAADRFGRRAVFLGGVAVFSAASLACGLSPSIAMFAAENMTSKDIAERLCLPVRTVDNHLQRAYAKLGVTGRADVAKALGSSS